MSKLPADVIRGAWMSTAKVCRTPRCWTTTGTCVRS
jgi:hypothetical protein